MRNLTFDERWPESWRYSYKYDLLEIYGDESNLGYVNAYNIRKEATIQLLREALPLGTDVLDIAAAQGNFTLTLAELGYCVTWNDLRADLADYVQLKRTHGSITFAPGNAFEIEFSSRFDAVLITEIIEHVAHPDEFLKKTASLVKPGGYIIMTTPNGGYLRNQLPRFSECRDAGRFEAVQFKPDADGHIFLLYRDEIYQLAKSAGLEIDRLLLLTNPLTAGHMKTSRLLRLLPQPVVSGIENASQKLPLIIRDKVMNQLAVRFRRW
jgi:2-polyprenyl-6-hydroxyphenyl methylase/3-demethylubiquinone-9 3-methyltransferase